MSTRCRNNRNTSFIALLLWFVIPGTYAAADARTLPGAPQSSSVEGRDYLLRDVALDPANTRLTGGIPVTLIDVFTGTGDWAKPDLARLPAYKANLPTKLRGRFRLFYGQVVGWMLVPAGWRVQFAAIGADGNTGYTFVAPTGAGSGWLAYGMTPACRSCLLSHADGLLPGAWHQLVAQGYVHGKTPWHPMPEPDSLDHPDDCTALLRYRSGELSVHAAVLSSEPMAALNTAQVDLSLAEVYAALPSSKAAIAEDIVARFRRTFPACRSPNGW